MLVSDSKAVSICLIGIFGILFFLLQDCLPSGSVDFTASASLQGICGSTLQLHTLRLAYAANSTLARLRCYDFIYTLFWATSRTK